MASKGRLLWQIGAFARRMSAGETMKTLQLAQVIKNVLILLAAPAVAAEAS